MLITLNYSEKLLNKIADAIPAQRQLLHLVQVGIAINEENAASLSVGYTNAAFTVLEAHSSLTGNNYVLRFAPDALHLVGIDFRGTHHRVRVVGPAGIIYEAPAKTRLPRTNRTTSELLEALLSAPVHKDTAFTIREAATYGSHGAYLYDTYGCTSAPGQPHRPFNVRKLVRAFPGISPTEKLRVQSWREIHLDVLVPYATSWFETTSGQPDEPHWTEIPLDRVAMLLATLAEGVDGYPSYLPFDKHALADGIIQVQDVEHLLRFCPALTSCKKQIAELQGKPFPRPLSVPPSRLT